MFVTRFGLSNRRINQVKRRRDKIMESLEVFSGSGV